MMRKLLLFLLAAVSIVFAQSGAVGDKISVQS